MIYIYIYIYICIHTHELILNLSISASWVCPKRYFSRVCRSESLKSVLPQCLKLADLGVILCGFIYFQKSVNQDTPPRSQLAIESMHCGKSSCNDSPINMQLPVLCKRVLFRRYGTPIQNDCETLLLVARHWYSTFLKHPGRRPKLLRMIVAWIWRDAHIPSTRVFELVSVTQRL